ncbi:MAG: ABC transporter permease [Prevotellaceae bacterium]|jgi:ABC-type antimicrobial peptide transport system permease subunit|nr:ABC transporter permease [Prevotellaceae bacterium]
MKKYQMNNIAGSGLGGGRMFYNLKISIRNLQRNGLYSWINVVGLAVSLAAVIFIALWVKDELSYDNSYRHVEDIYMLHCHYMENGAERYLAYLPAPLSRTIQAELAEVEAATALGYDWNLGYLAHEEVKNVKRNFTDFAFVDTSFFRVFDMEFVEGDAAHAFPDADAVVLLEETAALLFGSAPALGKTVKGDNGANYHVTGVVKSAPKNSLLQFKTLFSFGRTARKDHWRQWSNQVFVLLHPGADPKAVGEKIADIHSKHSDGYKKEFPYVVQPLSRRHLYAASGEETGMKNVRLFTIIAVALLVIACINYVNLVTARARKRAKEIGLRRLVGANRRQLFMQMMTETVLLFLVSIVVATALVYLLAPYYRMITDKPLFFNVLDAQVLLFYLCCFVFIIALAGVYPALFLSSFKFSHVFKTALPERRGRFSLRKLLIVLQFACSATLIMATVVLNRQQHFMQTKNLGYERAHIFTMDVMTIPNIRNSYAAFAQELSQQPGIVGVASSEQEILNIGNFCNFDWEGAPDETFSVASMGIDRHLFSLLDVSFVAGQGFSGTPADSTCVIVNEATVRMMNVSDPLNMPVYVSNWGLHGKITGVVKDFHFRHMSQPIAPMAMTLVSHYWTIYVKTAPGQAAEAIAATKRIWEKFDTEYPFTYKFMDDTFDEMYRNDIRTRNLFNVFALLAIFISCLGLFGLASYTAETKTKEIGIRKVLGATVADVIGMLSREFLLLVGVALLAAFPVAWYIMERMLQQYAYRISISWWIFALAAVAVTVLTVLSVGVQACRAATANPVKAIKTE